MAAVMGVASGPLAALVTIGEGDTESLLTANDLTDYQCDDLVVNGTLNMGPGTLINLVSVTIGPTGTINLMEGTINLSGDWINNGGVVTPGTSSQVIFNEDCNHGDINIVGDSTFWDLFIDIPGKTVIFGAGDTTKVEGCMSLTGDDGGRLIIKSDTPGSPSFLIVEACYTAVWVNVKDNHAELPGVWIDFGFPPEFNSIDSGGNNRWFRVGGGRGLIRFRVSKYFSDLNTEEVVTVTLHCNDGAYGPETQLVSQGNDATFVVDLIDAELLGPNCRIWEEIPDGYSPTYSTPNCHEPFTELCYADNDKETIASGCYYEDIHQDDGDSLNFCHIVNDPAPVKVAVTKVWKTFNQGGDVVEDVVTITIDCDSGTEFVDEKGNGTIPTVDVFSNKSKNGEPIFPAQYKDGEYTLTIGWIPEWFPTAVKPAVQEYTECWATEDMDDPAVEVTNECGDSEATAAMKISAGKGDSCTITNTVFFEGIPTLSQWGVAIMALLMLAVGLVGLRRFV